MKAAKILSENDFYAQEDRAVKVFVGIFLAIHVAALIFSGYDFFNHRKPLFEEWEMEADLYVGSELITPDKTTLPRAEVGKELAVPETMLPQLPKNVSVKTSAPQDQADAEDGDLSRDQDKAEKTRRRKEKRG